MARKTNAAESKVKNICRKTRKKYCAEEKIRIMIEGLQGEMSVAELSRKEGIAQIIYYMWSNEFAGQLR